jgi:hypothetical protein
MSLIPSGFFSFDPFVDMEAMLGLRRGDSGVQGAASSSNSLVAHMSPLTSASLRCNLVEVSAVLSVCMLERTWRGCIACAWLVGSGGGGGVGRAVWGSEGSAKPALLTIGTGGPLRAVPTLPHCGRPTHPPTHSGPPHPVPVGCGLQRPDHFEVTADVPGFTKDQVNVEVHEVGADDVAHRRCLLACQ